MALKDKLMTLEDFKAVRDVDVASNSAQFTEIKADLESKGLTDTVKVALFDAISHIGIWTDEHGQDYIDALEAVLFPPEGLVSISAVYTQSGTVYTTASLDSLKENLVVTATYEDESTAVIPASAYTLSGTLTAGTSTITASYGGKTATFNVTVTAPWTYEWNYSDGLPEDNGMTKAVTGNSTTSLTTDGVLMEAEDASGKYAQYYYAAADQSTVFTSGVYEFIFEINSFGSYNRAPYGNGVKVYLGMGQRNGNPAKCAELTFNESGVLHLVASGGSSTWETIDSTAFVTGREYSIRCEQNLTETKVYVDGTLVATIPASTNYETVTSQAFIAYRGISVVLKRFRFRLSA